MTILGRIRTVWFGVAGSPYYTNLHFASDIAGTGLQAASDAWTDFLQTHSTDFVASLVPKVDSDVPLIDDASGNLVGAAAISPIQVTTSGGGEALPRFTQALVRLETGAVIAGRRLRGRIFLPGMQETNSNTQGLPNPAMVASMNNNLETFLADANGSLVVYSPTHHDSFSVNAATVWSEWAVLRSRRD